MHAYVYAFAGDCRQAKACLSTYMHMRAQARKYVRTPSHEGIKKGAQAPWFLLCLLLRLPLSKPFF
jgi:hypothetical protein